MREEAAAASPLVPVIEALLGRPDGPGAQGFDGTATELLDKLKKICTEAQQKARWFPSSASAAGPICGGLRRCSRSAGLWSTRTE